MLSPAQFSAALFDEQARTLRIAEPGVRKKYSVALVRDMVLHWKEIPQDLKHLLSGAKEFYAEPGDVLPALYQFLSYTHVLNYRKDQRPEDRKGPDLMAAYFYDILWDGEQID
jgi:hypothetical protein